MQPCVSARHATLPSLRGHQCGLHPQLAPSGRITAGSTRARLLTCLSHNALQLFKHKSTAVNPLGGKAGSMAENFSPELLRTYYKAVFPAELMCRWLGYGTNTAASAQQRLLRRREFSFTTGDDVYIRYLSYDDAKAFRKDLCDKLPYKIDIGATYSAPPSEHKKFKVFQPVQRELIFDIDLTDYDFLEVDASKLETCDACWPIMAVAVKAMDRILRRARTRARPSARAARAHLNPAHARPAPLSAPHAGCGAGRTLASSTCSGSTRGGAGSTATCATSARAASPTRAAPPSPTTCRSRSRTAGWACVCRCTRPSRRSTARSSCPFLRRRCSRPTGWGCSSRSTAGAPCSRCSATTASPRSSATSSASVGAAPSAGRRSSAASSARSSAGWRSSSSSRSRTRGST